MSYTSAQMVFDYVTTVMENNVSIYDKCYVDKKLTCVSLHLSNITIDVRGDTMTYVYSKTEDVYNITGFKNIEDKIKEIFA